MAEEKRSLMKRLLEDASGAVMDLIYENVNNLFGAGDQLFTMEFPARPLNGATYQYDTDSCYSVLTKPVAVAEAEFILSNALYDLAPVVQGSNGEKLSTVFNKLLNNYVPKLDTLKAFVADKNHLRAWLLEEVDDVSFDKEHPEQAETVKISRMALCRKLYGEFLKQRTQWLQTKNKTYNEHKGANTLEEYAQWVTTEALVKDEELNNLFNDAVVRGNYHEVMTILGFLNIESPSEMLEKTKQNMRSSVKRSLDDSQDIYPVQFQPTDWFKALKPNLHPKDLTMSSEALVDELRTKQRRLQHLERDLTELVSREVTPERLSDLKVATQTAKQKLADTERELVAQNSKGAMDALHLAIKIFRTTADPLARFNEAVDAVKEARENGDRTGLSGLHQKLYDLLSDVATEAFQGMQVSFTAVSQAMSAMEQAMAAETEYAQAMTQNFDGQKKLLEEQIKDLQQEVEYLKPLVANTLSEMAAPSADTPADEEAEAKTPLLPTATVDDVSDSVFMDVIISSESITKKAAETKEAASSQNSWRVGGWFWSAGHNASAASSSSRKSSAEDTAKIEIGFRAAKVSLERGGWFNPSIFKMSNSFYRLSEMRASGGVNKDMIRKALLLEDADTALKKLVTYLPDEKNPDQSSRCSYILPAFPTAFVIAKDITIRVHVDSATLEAEKSFAQSQCQSSGGFFGFSASSGSNAQKASESSYIGSRNQFIYIRIPGPQILGWFQQLVPADQAEGYQAQGNPFSADDILRMLNPTSPLWSADFYQNAYSENKEQEMTNLD